MQGNDSFRLIVRRGPQPNQTYDLNKDIITLGRDITNDITINDPEVSRHHLRLTRGAGGFTLEDLGSTNGTFINGQRMTGARPLNVGDMIGLGETVTLGYDIVRAGAAPGPAPTAAGPTAAPPAGQNPYAPPTPGGQQPYPPQQPQQPYPQQPQQQPYDYGQPQAAQPAQPAYGQPGQQQQYYTPPYGAPPAAPPGAGYEYDPYAIREEEPRSATRWIVIGCAGIALFCCCATVIGFVIIDAMQLWYDIPIIKDIAPMFESIARALGLIG
jgi:hypothetical protein